MDVFYDGSLPGPVSSLRSAPAPAGGGFTQRLLETCPDCIYVYDLTARRSLYRNRKLHDMLGYADEEIECLQAVIPQQLLHPDDRVSAEGLMAIWRDLPAGEVLKVEFRLRDQSGKWRHFCSRITSLTRNAGGETTQILGMISDVSAQKWAEAGAEEARAVAERASATKSQFLAQMSHEIRTPLGGIIGMASLLATTALSAEQKDYAETITRTADTLQAIVDDVLDYSKIEAGRLELHEQPFQILEVVDDALRSVAEQAGKKNLALYAAPVAAWPPRLIGDSSRIRQVLLNFLSNAVKFTAAGEVRLDVEFGPMNGKVRARLTVTDTGIGVPQGAQARLFEKYQQADAAIAGCYGGTGLGLAISRQLAHLMGGSIGYREALRGGSCFWLELTLERAEDEGVAPIAVDLRGCSALVMSDHESSGKALSESLALWGAVPRLGSLSAPVTAWAETAARADVIVVDRQHGGTGMPDLAGLRPPRAGRTRRVVLLTPLGPTYSAVAQQAKAAGFDVCLPQPASLGRLAHALLADTATDEPVLIVEEPPGVSLRKEDVLIVDDNPDNRSILARMIEKSGFICRQAASGHEAVEAVRKAPPALVFMDCQMPGMNGFEATRAIRALDAGRDVPIIALTANVLGVTASACREAGMRAVLTKPIRLDELRRYLNEWMPG